MSVGYFNSKTLAVITGASQGYGRQVAVSISKRLKSKSHIFLLARNNEGLKETKSLIKNPHVEVECVPADLSKSEETESVIEKCFTNLEKESFEHYILVNNAGSLGNVTSPAKNFKEQNEVDEYMSFNLSSPIVLTSRFISAINNQDSVKISIINVSSLCGIQPWPSYAMYCSGKAARDMYFKVLAVENSNMVILNWAPGPLDTAMAQKAMTQSCSEKVRSTYKSMMYVNKTILSCEQSAEKLLEVLAENTFKSGDHVDYYD